jgi:hypothetical protein
MEKTDYPFPYDIDTDKKKEGRNSNSGKCFILLVTIGMAFINRSRSDPYPNKADDI